LWWTKWHRDRFCCEFFGFSFPYHSTAAPRSFMYLKTEFYIQIINAEAKENVVSQKRVSKAVTLHAMEALRERGV
jgi:hypothetical protein